MKIRVEVSHYIRERMVVDVEVPNRRTYEYRKKDIYDAALELQGWALDPDDIPQQWSVYSFIELDMDNPNLQPSHDTEPDATMTMPLDDEPVVVTDAGNHTNLTAIQRVLLKNRNKCLDNEPEREAILAEILKVLR